MQEDLEGVLQALRAMRKDLYWGSKEAQSWDRLIEEQEKKIRECNHLKPKPSL